jgi:cyclohexanone monooxygenase
MSNPQAGFTASFPHLLDEQAKHLAYIISNGIEKGLRTVEVSEAGAAGWVEQCLSKARLAKEFFENCTPGYYNNEGKTSERSTQNGFYGGGSIEFFQILEKWRADGQLEGMEQS